ncbi:MAG TPA: hypothetical protein VMX57_04635, partial [Planctomycetota bacterium]|nr:hypothetical protein [Planctomycetota bacterium]
MRRPTLHLVLLAATLFLLPAAPSRAELTLEQAKTAEALIKQFESRQFAARQKAVDELTAMGPDVLPLVRQTLAETK